MVASGIFVFWAIQSLIVPIWPKQPKSGSTSMLHHQNHWATIYLPNVWISCSSRTGMELTEMVVADCGGVLDEFQPKCSYLFKNTKIRCPKLTLPFKFTGTPCNSILHGSHGTLTMTLSWLKWWWPVVFLFFAIQSLIVPIWPTQPISGATCMPHQQNLLANQHKA